MGSKSKQEQCRMCDAANAYLYYIDTALCDGCLAKINPLPDSMSASDE